MNKIEKECLKTLYDYIIGMMENNILEEEKIGLVKNCNFEQAAKIRDIQIEKHKEIPNLDKLKEMREKLK